MEQFDTETIIGVAVLVFLFVIMVVVLGILQSLNEVIDQLKVRNAKPGVAETDDTHSAL